MKGSHQKKLWKMFCQFIKLLLLRLFYEHGGGGGGGGVVVNRKEGDDQKNQCRKSKNGNEHIG